MAVYVRTSRTSSRIRATRTASDPVDRQMWQLVVCLLLFVAVYIGRGVFPEQTAPAATRLVAVLTSDLDLRASITQLGRSIGELPLENSISAFCREVFAADSTGEEHEDTRLLPTPDLLAGEQTFLRGSPESRERAAHFLGEASLAHLSSDVPAVPEPPESEAVPEASSAIPSAGTVLLRVDHAEEDLPRNCTLDQLSLGTLTYTAPVSGGATSGYGYRTHPINGDYLFHTGIDLQGSRGEPIVAFADGTVQYVGKDSSYGLYFQLDHGNGIKSFYAHCDSLCVTKGQRVSMGDVVASVGSTGTATGPHLHFELKYERLRMDPAYYLDL